MSPRVIEDCYEIDTGHRIYQGIRFDDQTSQTQKPFDLATHIAQMLDEHQPQTFDDIFKPINDKSVRPQFDFITSLLLQPGFNPLRHWPDVLITKTQDDFSLPYVENVVSLLYNEVDWQNNPGADKTRCSQAVQAIHFCFVQHHCCSMCCVRLQTFDESG